MNPRINIGIDDTHRKEIGQGLCTLLADTYTLYLKTHNFHWNVTGPMFSILHSLFEQQYTELQDAVDTVAERIRALGVRAPGSFNEFTQLTSIKESTGVPGAEDMIAQLLEGHETVARTCRSIMPLVEKGGDDVSQDMLTERMQVHQKTAWMLRSLLEESPS